MVERVGHIEPQISPRQEALTNAYVSSYEKLVGYLRRHFPSSHAEDLAQQAYTNAFERVDGLDHETSLNGYLWKSAINLGRSLLRKSEIKSGTSLDTVVFNDSSHPLHERLGEEVVFLRTQMESPEQHAIVKDDLETIIDAIANLPLQQRRAVGLHLRDYNHAEIGQELGMAPVTSRAYVHKGIKRVRSSLG